MLYLRLCCGVLVTMALAACAGGSIFHSSRVETDKPPTKADERAPNAGVLYGLPKVYVTLTFKREEVAGKLSAFTITSGDPVVVADPAHIYRLNYEHSIFSKSDVKVEVTSDGLLDAITTATKDSVPGAIASLANFLVSVATQGIGAGFQPEGDKGEGGRTRPPPPPPHDRGPFTIKATFDPSDPSDPTRKALEEELDHYGVDLEIKAPDVPLAAEYNRNVESNCNVMVCYRIALPYVVTATDDKVSMTKVQAVVLSPNQGPIGGIRLVRRSFVENKFTLDFEKGILTKARFEDPSAVSAAVEIPVNIAKAIVSIPSALFRFTVATETDAAEMNHQKDVLAAQKELIQAQIDLVNKQKELDKQQPGTGR